MFRLSLRRPGSPRVLARFLGFILLGVPFTVRGADLGFKVEPGVAFPLSQPQSGLFDAGGGAAFKLLYGLGPSADLAATVSFVGLPRSNESPSTVSSSAGTGWGYGGGLRLKGPHEWDAAMSPWIDADALYVRTGGLNRFGIAAGVGLAFPVGNARMLWMGPFVRYEQIVGHNATGVDARDAKILLAGLSFEFGASPERPPGAERCPECPAIAKLPDRDNDGVPDIFDRCPDVPGPIENQGCPVYKKVVVREDRLELREKIQFLWDSPRIEESSHAVLDEAVRVLQDNRRFRVQIEGHASSEGGDEHNQTLSEQRAQAVLDYLASHGVARDRLSSKGFSSSRPIESNVTESGREANRRVEFIVHLIIVKEGSAQ